MGSRGRGHFLKVAFVVPRALDNECVGNCLGGVLDMFERTSTSSTEVYPVCDRLPGGRFAPPKYGVGVFFFWRGCFAHSKRGLGVFSIGLRLVLCMMVAWRQVVHNCTYQQP